MALFRLHRVQKTSRPPSRSAQQRKLALEGLEARTLLSLAPPVDFSAGIHPRSVTVADFNNDGKADLAVVNMGQLSNFQGSLSVLLGNGDGSFRPAVTTNLQDSGQGQGTAETLAVGDFNGDHLLDVALNTGGSNGSPAVEVLFGKGDGTFQPNHEILSVGQVPLSLAAGDFDGNGTLDLVTANSSSGTLSVLLGNGDGTFRPRTDLAVGGAPRTVVVGDFNGDGRADVAVGQQITDTVSVLTGRGDGTFAPPQVVGSTGTQFAPASLAVGDVNGDGRSDLVVNSIGGEDTPVSQLGVLLGNGNGTFQAPILHSPQIGGDGDVVLGDFNHDGRTDAVVGSEASGTDGLGVFIGNGDGSFQPFPQTISSGGDDPLGVAAADLNGDGLVDLVAANTFFGTNGPGTVGVLLNNSTGTAAATTTTTLVSSAPTAGAGQTETLTATVSSRAGVPTGSIVFFDGSTVLGGADVNAAGQATLAVSLGVGSHALTASFVGTGGFAGSTSAVVTEKVNPVATTVALASSLNPAVAGQAVTFTATVAAGAPQSGAPTGTVTFKDGSVVLGTVAVGATGTATLTTSFASAGGHAITAVYSGDATFAGGSQALTEQVTAATHRASTTSLFASATTVRVGQAVAFTATVRDPSGTSTPTGTVTFFVGNTVVARVTLDANGQARLRGSFSIAGRFTIRAVYSGDATFGTSEQSLTEQVNA
jgi:hypothetical protein